MRKVVFFALISFFVLLLSSCEDSNPVNNTEVLEFTLKLSQNISAESNNILVTFITNDSKNPPIINVNGYQLEKENYTYPFEIGNRHLLQGQRVIPYSNSCSYSISINGKTTFGSIDMPILPKIIMCNGVELKNNSLTSLKLTDSLKFSWNADSANSSFCSLSNDSYYKAKIADFETSLFTISDSARYEFAIKSINASYFRYSDYEPDNLEYYDDAFIISETNFNRYSIGFLE